MNNNPITENEINNFIKALNHEHKPFTEHDYNTMHATAVQAWQQAKQGNLTTPTQQQTNTLDAASPQATHTALGITYTMLMPVLTRILKEAASHGEEGRQAVAQYVEASQILMWHLLGPHAHQTQNP